MLYAHSYRIQTHTGSPETCLGLPPNSLVQRTNPACLLEQNAPVPQKSERYIQFVIIIDHLRKKSTQTDKYGRSVIAGITTCDTGLQRLGIRPYTPRHNDKVERSHRKDHAEFYASHRFYIQSPACCPATGLQQVLHAPALPSLP